MNHLDRNLYLLIFAAMLFVFVPKTSANPVGKIISDITTSSNRIVIVEKDGVQKTAYIPSTMANALTDEQILYSVFHTNSPPPPSNQKLNEHLTFYGLTVDDQTNALAGVTITGSVLVMDSENPGHQVPVETTSDGNGRFQFDVDYGQVITINVRKGTNYISPPTQLFRYPPGWYGPTDSELISNPDAANPIVFVLPKKQKPEPLIEVRTGMGAPNTGELVRIDVTTGKVVPTGGDLIVSITCPEPFKAGVHIPWKLVLTATDLTRHHHPGRILNPISSARLAPLAFAPLMGLRMEFTETTLHALGL